jgi:hypothetical protein
VSYEQLRYCKSSHKISTQTVTVHNIAVYIIVTRMGEDRGVHRELVGKPEGKRPLGRPRRRWEDNIKMDLQEVEGGRGGWMELA